MRKKIINLLFIAIIVMFFTGCEKKDTTKIDENNNISKATIINNEGKTEQLSSSDIIDIYKENDAKFQKYYLSAKISFDGTIKSISTESYNCYDTVNVIRYDNGINTFVGTSGSSDKRKCISVYFEEGYKLFIPESNLLDVADISKGDKYHVDSNIANIYNDSVECFGMYAENSGDFDLTEIKKIS